MSEFLWGWCSAVMGFVVFLCIILFFYEIHIEREKKE
jgi:hypothetical protein